MATTLTPDPQRLLGRPEVVDARHLQAPRRLPRPRQGARHGAGGDHPGRQGLLAARPRRRRVPHRHEVVVHGPAGRRPPLPRRQRRRVRAGHLQGRPADDGQPARAHRGRRDQLVRHRLRARLHLPARRGRPRLPPPAARGRGGLRRRPPRQERPRHRRQPRHHRARRRGRLHLRRGDRAPRQPRGPPRPAAQQAAVPRRRGPVRPADLGQQRRVDRVGPRHHPRGRRLVHRHGHREVHRLRHLQPVRPRQEPRPVRGPARHHACASCSTWPAACATPTRP